MPGVFDSYIIEMENPHNTICFADQSLVSAAIHESLTWVAKTNKIRDSRRKTQTNEHLAVGITNGVQSQLDNGKGKNKMSKYLILGVRRAGPGKKLDQIVLSLLLSKQDQRNADIPLFSPLGALRKQNPFHSTKLALSVKFS